MELNFILIIFGLLIMVFLSFFAGKSLGKRMMFEIMQEVIQKERKDAVNKSRAVLKGQFSEQLSPFNEDFPLKASEVRFFGAPIDFIGFIGLDEKDVSEIVFLDIKTGNARLNETQRSIKKAIENKRVRFEEYRI